ncbi:peptidoglycan-binding protein [Afifella sp. IM 167]|uniref:peptidoglycan-binding protein n=1 Tax=Afifella sp. IM 167 TaxID=2033586 RepID=UPI001CCF20A8|nr:peptidoglycan-binding protein [Afifella sp. IM 167]MBZ8134392.1 hypothetical protein [Afifella sp. IM 167]
MSKAQIAEQLFDLREALEAPYAAAKEVGDEQKMQELIAIAKEIDDILDTIAIRNLADLATDVGRLKARIDALRQSVSDPLRATVGSAIAELRQMVSEIVADSAEEEVRAFDEVVDRGPRYFATVEVAGSGAAASGNPVFSEAHLVGLWKRSQFPIWAEGATVFGLRGCRPVDYAGTDFKPEQEIQVVDVNYTTMNCTIGQWRPGGGISVFPGSTVPYGPLVRAGIGKSGEGVNQLGRGRYQSYKAGWHKRSEGSAGHWALQQNCPVTLQRTADDADYDGEDRWEFGAIAGDNIHCAFGMGVDGRIPDSKYSSAGCQTIAGTVIKGRRGSERGPWKKFIAPFLPGPGGQAFTEYVLFDAREMIQMLSNQYKEKTIILRFGSEGPLVQELQQALRSSVNSSLQVDGVFGIETFRAVLEFQTTHFGPSADDGIVGPETAMLLGISLPEFDFANATGGGPGYRPERRSGRVRKGGSSRPIAWGKVTEDLHGSEFNQKVIDMSARLDCDPDHLMAVMAFETGRSFKPDQKNAAGSGATGLIQFMPLTAQDLGTTIEKLETMSAIEQLDYVEMHFDRSRRGRAIKTLSDVYMAVLWPAAVGKADSSVLFQKSSDPRVNTRYVQNRSLDINRDGLVTKAEATKRVSDMLIEGLKRTNVA